MIPRALLLLVLFARPTAASVEDSLPAEREAMPRYPGDTSKRGRARRLVVNGMPLWFATGRTSHAPSAVRRFYEEAMSGERFGGVAPMPFGDERQGGLAALDLGAKLSQKERLARLRRFLSSGDLGELGRPRYLLHQDDGAGGTQYLTMWSDAAFAPRKLMPVTGDAPGRDPDGIRRCPGGTRVLSAAEQGQPYGLYAYRCPGASAQVRGFFEAQLRSAGWQLDENFRRFAGDRGRVALHATRGAADVFLDVANAGEETAVHIVEVSR